MNMGPGHPLYEFARELASDQVVDLRRRLDGMMGAVDMLSADVRDSDELAMATLSRIFSSTLIDPSLLRMLLAMAVVDLRKGRRVADRVGE